MIDETLSVWPIRNPLSLWKKVALSEPKFGPFGTKVWPFRNPEDTLGYMEQGFAESVTLTT